jgi:uridine kinase
MTPVLVAITGGSGSGKTTVAHALAGALPRGAAVVVEEDRYYRDSGRQAGFDARTFDFDHVDARDHALLLAHLDALKAGESVRTPRYCFRNHWRKRGTDLVPPAPVVILEGIHLLATPELAQRFDLRVYVDTPDDIRLIRRLLRDTGAKAEGGRGRRWRQVVEQYLGTVRPAHLAHTAPTAAEADLVLTDASTRLGGPDPAQTAALIEPLLRHPVLRAAMPRIDGEAADQP